MLRNYLTVAFRNLVRHKGYSFINILGLTVGLACFLLIALYVKDELSYDRFHHNASRIYRVTRDFVSQDGAVSLHLGHVAPPFGPLLKNDFDEIEHSVRLLENGGLLQYKENAFNEEQIFFADKDLFRVFTFKVTQGNPDQALADPFSVMFSRPMAEKYFKGEDPVGKVVRISDQFNLMVTGVFEPLPAQSHFHPDFLVSFSTLEDSRIYGKERLRTNFGNNAFGTYILLPEKYDVSKMTRQFPAFIDKHMHGGGAVKPSSWTHLYLQKLTDIHLKSHLDSEMEANGDMDYIYIFSAIGLFILLIACINYMNLATARSAGRAKEVGLRKVIGAQQTQLIGQFLSESAVLTVIALVLALVLAVVMLPYLNEFTGKALTINTLQDGSLIALVFGLAILTGLLAGSYPAFLLASFQPVKVLKGKLSTATRNSTLRQTLVVLQFGISIFLIICTAIVFRQLNFMENQQLGFRKDQILLLDVVGDSTVNYEAMKGELKSHATIKEVGRSSRIPSGRLLDSQGARVMKGDSLEPTEASIKNLAVDHDFIPTYEMKLLAGRNFSRNYTTDTASFILNEAAIKSIGWNRPEQAIDQVFEYGNRKGRIIGVLKDFHFESMHQTISPMVLFMNPDHYNRLSVSIAGKDAGAAISHAEKVWRKFLPNRPFEYEFLDQRFADLYQAEQTRGVLFTIFASLSIFIACLGLFGLASYTITQRSKEISVRKVLGASVSGIVTLLSKEFVRLVGIAFLVSIPLAWYVMHQWLKDFAYRISIGADVFILAGVIALLIALVTVSFQAVKAALANPVKALRNNE